MTYAQLAKKLQSLGYTEHHVDVRSKPARVFEHKLIKNALIFLPDGADANIVEPPFLGQILLILKTHGLIEEKNSLLIEQA